jgi:hypothetical protein
MSYRVSRLRSLYLVSHGYYVFNMPRVAPQAEEEEEPGSLLRPLSLVRRSALFLHACSPEDGRYLMASRFRDEPGFTRLTRTSLIVSQRCKRSNHVTHSRY